MHEGRPDCKHGRYIPGWEDKFKYGIRAVLKNFKPILVKT
jgi:hypothetical protein